MAWLSITTRISSDTPVLATVLNNIGSDIRAWGANVDASGYALTNCLGVTGPSGANPITISTNGTERVRVLSGGNVGIGTATPAGILDVRYDTAAGRTNITFSNGAAANTSNLLRLRLSPSVGFIGTDLHPYLESYQESAANQDSGLALGTYNSGAVAERVRITSAGRVGIGKTVPLSALAVHGLPSYANNAAAITGGLTADDCYLVTSSNPRTVAIVF